jgi:hypothetical protein
MRVLRLTSFILGPGLALWLSRSDSNGRPGNLMELGDQGMRSDTLRFAMGRPKPFASVRRGFIAGLIRKRTISLSGRVSVLTHADGSFSNLFTTMPMVARMDSEDLIRE